MTTRIETLAELYKAVQTAKAQRVLCWRAGDELGFARWQAEVERAESEWRAESEKN